MNFQIRVVKNQIAATQRLIESGCKQYILQLIDLEIKLEELEAAAIAQAQAKAQNRKRRSMMDTAKILASGKMAAQFQTRQDCIEYVLYNFRLITEQIQVVNPDLYDIIMYKPRRRRA